MCEVLDRFDFDNTPGRLDEAGLLYFYRYVPLPPLEEIEADSRAIEKDIIRRLAEMTGSAVAGRTDSARCDQESSPEPGAWFMRSRHLRASADIR